MNAKSFVKIALCTMLIAFGSGALAQQKFVRGQGTAKDKKEALAAAKKSAWNNYKAEIEGGKLDNVMANEKLLLENIDDLMIDVTVISEECKDSCVIRIKATVNENQIESKLRSIAKASGGKNDGAKKEGADDIAMLVMARVADVKKSYDNRVTKKSEATVSTKGSQASKDVSDATDNSSSESMSDAQSATQSAKTVSSGTTESKQATITYKPWAEISDLQNRVSEVLTINKLAISSWQELVTDCHLPSADKFSQMFAESETGTLPDKVMADIISKLKAADCGVGKLVITSITIDGHREDANTGLQLATGNINVQAMDISGRRSKQLGAANRTFSGRGAEALDAGRDALKNSAKVAADAIINQVNLR
jgi:hypothetical protein